jgi:hypothetical protein
MDSAASPNPASSGNDIGNELIFELRNLIFEAQFAPLHPGELQLISWPRYNERRKGGVQIMMLFTQKRDL